MPCRVRKEVWLEHPAETGIRKQTKTSLPYFQNKKNKEGDGGVYLFSKCKTGDCPIFATKPLILKCLPLNY